MSDKICSSADKVLEAFLENAPMGYFTSSYGEAAE